MLVRPFAAIRAAQELAPQIAALPYDVYTRAEAAREVEGKPLSFLNIDRPETQFPPDTDMYANEVYAHAREILDARRADGTYVTEQVPCFFLYELVMNGRAQIGVVGCCSIDEYAEGTVKKHENTLERKEIDRLRHIGTLDAQTSPIFLTYRDSAAVDAIVATAREAEPLYEFTAVDGVKHTVWRIADEATVEALEQAFSDVPAAYIADGHHRAASAVKLGLARRGERGTKRGEAESDYFMTVLFPAGQMKILSYNRIVRDLNGLTPAEFLERVTGAEGPFELLHEQDAPLEPIDKGAVGMYLAGRWYGLGARDSVTSNDPVAGLDVSILQDYVLDPILGIDDPRTDERISFVGGARGLDELSRRVDAIDAQGGRGVAFAMYPTAIEELLAVADVGKLMPPKSTWFEPKPRSGLFFHDIS